MDYHGLRTRLQQSKKAMAVNKCIYVAGRFDGHADALEQYGAHHLIQHDQGFTGSHRTPPLGNLYRPGSRQGDNQQNNNEKCTHFAGHFDSHCDAAVRYCVHRPMEEVCACKKATKHHHRASTCSDKTNWTNVFYRTRDTSR
jgi:hypothetical protein